MEKNACDYNSMLKGMWRRIDLLKLVLQLILDIVGCYQRYL